MSVQTETGRDRRRILTVPPASAWRGKGTGRAAAGVLLVTGIAIAVVFGTADRAGNTDLSFTSARSLIRFPTVNLPTRPVIFIVAAVCVALGLAALVYFKPKRHTGAVLVATVMTFIALLLWGTAGGAIDVQGLLTVTVSWSIVLTLGACAGVMSERAGAINVGLEGMMLSGAFCGAVIGSVGGGVIGLAAAVAVGGLFGLVLGIGTIRYRADQIIVGIAINILVLGLTNYLYNSLLTQNPELNSITRFGTISIPVLSDLPVIGPALFEQRIFGYVAIVGAVLLHFALRRTRWGLHVNAVGENPQAADTMGINVHRVRYRNMIFSGMISGFAGAYLSMGLIGSFTLNMTNGIGFVALAVMIAGRWRPLGALGAALLFGLAKALQGNLSNANAPIASEFLLMLPYLATIVVVVGVVGASVAPAADGQPFVKE
jgi:simple sugar transport system permease protein